MLAYMANMKNLEAEEALASLKILSNPKPVYMIDGEKSKRAIDELGEVLASKINDTDKKPYYEDTEVDHDGIARLKEVLSKRR